MSDPIDTRRFQYHLLEPIGLTNPLVQPGELAYYPSNAIPAGWLPCDGSWYYPSAQPALFQAIGYRHGKDAQGRFRVLEVFDFTQPCNPNLGDTPFITVADGVRSHSHDGGVLGGDGNHDHTITIPTWIPVSYHIQYILDGVDQSGTYGAGGYITVGASGDHSHSVTLTGGGGVESAPKHIILSLCVCAGGDSLGYLG